jgi:hypothetical protein
MMSTARKSLSIVGLLTAFGVTAAFLIPSAATPSTTPSKQAVTASTADTADRLSLLERTSRDAARAQAKPPAKAPKSTPAARKPAAKVQKSAPAVKKAAPKPKKAKVTQKVSKAPLTGWKATYWNKAQAWAVTPKAKSVLACETGGGNYANVNPKAVSRTGKYRGAWQMDSGFWASYGGLELAPRPDAASWADQNYVAYRGFVSRGWQPWACA